MQFTAETWQQISRLLDEALDVDPASRAQWLESLSPDYSHLREILRELLLRRDGTETANFLRRLPDLGQPGPQAAVAAGSMVGPYRLIRELGIGGMATVWLAERSDGSLRRKVALKLPRVAWIDRGLIARMTRERDIVAALEHTNIARLYDAGIDAMGRPYLALEYVDGVPLDVYCRERALTIQQRLDLFLQITRGIAYAHARLIVHRDLKPSNILITHAGEVRLLDFGIATLLQSDSTQAGHTQHGGRALTPTYAAPEQFTGQQITVATDVYSLGVILYELLTGISPYAPKGRSPTELECAVLQNAPPTASSVVAPDTKHLLQGDLDNILAKALKKSPADRYSTVEAFEADIERHLSGLPIAARPASRWYVVRKFMRRNVVVVSASAAVVGAVVLGLGIALWQWEEANHQRVLAVDRLTEAEAALDFTQAVLTEGIQRGESVTLDELLSRSEAIGEEFGEHDSRMRSAASDIVAGWYTAYGDYEKAERILTQSIDALPADDRSPLRYKRICDRARAWQRMGRTDEALASITEAIEHTRDDPATTGYCLVKRAGLARHMNDGKAALAFASEALRQYARAGRQSAELTTEVLGEIAYAHTLIGNSDLAQQFHAQAMRVLESRGRQQSHYALSLLNNWGAATLAGGNPRLALEYFEQAIALAQRRSPTGDPPFQLLDGKSAMLQILARYDAARAANEELWRIVSRGSEPVAYLCALSRKAQLEHRLGRFNEAQRFLDEANTLITKHKLPAYNPAVLRTRITQALVWAAQHRTSDAMASFTQLLEDFGRLNCCVETRVNLLLSRAELAASGGHLAEALVDATAALEIAQRLQGRLPFSFYTGRAYLVLGQVHRARHQLQEAKRAYEHAVQNLSPALGEQHPDTLQALHAAQVFVPVKK